MPVEYKNIPPERETAYLQYAEAAFNEAAEPVIAKLGEATVKNAEDIVAGKETTLGPVFQAEKITKDAAQFPETVETYTHNYDVGQQIAQSAEIFLAENSLPESGHSKLIPNKKATYYIDPAFLTEYQHLTDNESTALNELDNPTPPPLPSPPANVQN